MTRPSTPSPDTLTRLLEQIEATRAEIEASRQAIEASEVRLRDATDLLTRAVGARGDLPVPVLQDDGDGDDWIEPEASEIVVPDPDEPLPQDARAARDDDEDYLHIISHDLKEPMRGILYFSQLLAEDHAARLDDEGREHLEYIQSATRRMSRLLEDILTLSRLRRRPIVVGEVDLEAIARGVMEELRKPLQEKRGRFDIVGALPVVRGDRDRLRELFTHLIRNAITFSDAPVRIEVRGEGARHGEYRVSVRDHGIGIEPQFQDQIFGLFQRLHSWEAIEGTGAGLTLARKIVKLHGGRIGVESRAGQGATFWFTLPVGGPPVSL